MLVQISGMDDTGKNKCVDGLFGCTTIVYWSWGVLLGGD